MPKGLSSPALTSEEDLQRTVMEGLELLGYIVLQTTHRVKAATCPKCGQKFRPAGGYGSSKGVPDLIVTRKTWPWYAWVGIELKGPKTAVSPEQKALAADDRIAICRTWEEVKVAIGRFETSLRAVRG